MGGGIGFWLWILIGRGFVSWVDGVGVGWLDGVDGVWMVCRWVWRGGRGKGSVVIWNRRGEWGGRNIYEWKVGNGGEDGSKLESGI